ncbi:recombination mediator RecR [Marinilabilia salmonicolor]|jgi:recombination protein RecR|uniref:Recombination protein RecR n=1 Tax=Marinilabilia salmonicolor TaxID=989 RepID=A0A2T0XNL3_9BACT|nr:recombination mediator RecR [Marinilabilia salmonicolor]PRZ00521.1 DNA replication and repair protein RecR [Marinilabilia salmonicolor]RCW32731.1 DNA replication and repair protein RecR [Marinilabilia salmonicolor]
MSDIQFPSKILENAVNEFSKLPGIGRKTALRLVLHILKQEKESAYQFADAITTLADEIKYCKSCYNISDSDICSICSNPRRDHSVVCVVENVRDVMAIENTHQYQGIYHVLGGLISPMDGTGPDDLTITPLEEKLKSEEVKEIIFALSTTMEGDTTNFFLYRKFQQYPVKFSTIARGVAIGDELEYADEVTLGRSLVDRQPFEKNAL